MTNGTVVALLRLGQRLNERQVPDSTRVGEGRDPTHNRCPEGLSCVRFCEFYEGFPPSEWKGLRPQVSLDLPLRPKGARYRVDPFTNKYHWHDVDTCGIVDGTTFTFPLVPVVSKGVRRSQEKEGTPATGTPGISDHTPHKPPTPDTNTPTFNVFIIIV